MNNQTKVTRNVAQAIDDTTRQVLIDARHAALCERAECVSRCEAGHCRCAGCEAHMDDYVATLETVDIDLVTAICEAHGVARKVFWFAAGTDPIDLPIGSVLAALAEARSWLRWS